jgi:hypothetical protein
MSEPARDPIGDFQRWLMKAGARSLSREVAGKVKSTLGTSGGDRGKHASVWETATTEPPGDEPPECQWCPICRAARRYRDSGGGATVDLGSQLAGVSDALAGFTRDAFGLFESAMRAQQRAQQRPTGQPADGSSDSDRSDDSLSDNSSVVGPGVTWAAVVHAEDEDGEAADEGGHREEGGEPRDAAADSGGDEQVEGTPE